jgi:hypothetical protein
MSLCGDHGTSCRNSHRTSPQANVGLNSWEICGGSRFHKNVQRNSGVGVKSKCPETLAKRHGIDPGVETIWRWMLAEEAIQISFVATPIRPGTPHQFIRQRQRSLIQLCPQLRAPSLSFLEVIDHDRW